MSGPTADDMDGWVILHTQDDEGYGIGPYPTMQVAALVVAAMACDCNKTIVGVIFPRGVSMAIDLDIDTSTPATRAGDHLN